MRGIAGSKDVESWAGNVDIAVGAPNDYSTVDASVTAGDLLVKTGDGMAHDPAEPSHIAERARNKKILLLEAKPFSLPQLVVRIKNLADILRANFLLGCARVIAHVEELNAVGEIGRRLELVPGRERSTNSTVGLTGRATVIDDVPRYVESGGGFYAYG